MGAAETEKASLTRRQREALEAISDAGRFYGAPADLGLLERLRERGLIELCERTSSYYQLTRAGREALEAADEVR